MTGHFVYTRQPLSTKMDLQRCRSYYRDCTMHFIVTSSAEGNATGNMLLRLLIARIIW